VLVLRKALLNVSRVLMLRGRAKYLCPISGKIFPVNSRLKRGIAG
jgi:hypothetical protein